MYFLIYLFLLYFTIQNGQKGYKLVKRLLFFYLCIGVFLPCNAYQFFKNWYQYPFSVLTKYPFLYLTKRTLHATTANTDIKNFVKEATGIHFLGNVFVSDKTTACYNPMVDFIMISSKDDPNLVSLQTLHQKYGTKICDGLTFSCDGLIKNGWDPKDAQSIKTWIFFLNHEAGHRHHHQKKLSLSAREQEIYADNYACKKTDDLEVLKYAALYFETHGKKYPYSPIILEKINANPNLKESLLQKYPKFSYYLNGPHPHSITRAGEILFHYNKKKPWANYQQPILNTRLPF